LQYEPAVHANGAASRSFGQYEPTGQMVAALLFEGQYVVALH
jgi:hypothetical protein